MKRTICAQAAVAIIGLFVLNACQTAETGASPPSLATEMKPSGGQMVCSGYAAGNTAFVTFNGDQPVGYRWGSYNAQKVSRLGQTMYFDAATYSYRQTDPQTLTGTFTLGAHENELTLHCPGPIKLN